MLHQGQRVEFEIFIDERSGKERAGSVRLIK